MAREFYRPPDYQEDVEPIDLIEKLRGKIWSHEEGQKLLRAMMEQGVSLHNTLNKSREAIKVFKEMGELDTEDNLVSTPYFQC